MGQRELRQWIIGLAFLRVLEDDVEAWPVMLEVEMVLKELLDV